jgi:hypothetical protein
VSAFYWLGVVLASVNLLLFVGFLLALFRFDAKRTPIIVQMILSAVTALWLIGALRWQA